MTTMTETQTASSTTRNVVNGLDLDALFALIEGVKQDAAKGKTSWRVTTSWRRATTACCSSTACALHAMRSAGT